VNHDPKKWRGFEEFVKLSAFLDSVGAEVIEFSGNQWTTSCELAGSLSYWLTLECGILSLHARDLDCIDPPQEILRLIPASDWQVIAKLVAAMEFSKVKSLSPRPLEVIDRYGERWMIA
jgi:hypothetical protein